jgi:hypothetical protein
VVCGGGAAELVATFAEAKFPSDLIMFCSSLVDALLMWQVSIALAVLDGSHGVVARAFAQSALCLP